MKTSIIIVLFFIVGLILAVFSMLPDIILQNDYSSYMLYFLMFFVGISIGIDKNILKILKGAKFRILLVPLSVIVGTLLGVGISSVFLSDINLREALAVGSGFGYYSLSSIFITQLSGSVLGVIALLSNILREVITLLASPLLIKYFGKLAPIASGGATAMDTTLPIIVKFSGKEYGIIAVFSGIVLTILVPFIVTFILS